MNDFFKKQQWSSWLLAARPKTLTAAFVPILAATLLAQADFGTVNWKISLYAFLASVFIQIGTNLFNDALDYKKGADTFARLGPVRATQSGLLAMEQVLAGGMICFALAVLLGIPLILQGGWPLAVILLCSVLSGYFYTGGPRPLAYSGLGDPFVIIFFGFVATVSVYYLQTGYVSSESFLAGAQIGLLITALLAVNNLRDVEGDAKSNKRTLPVRFGKMFGRVEISVLILLPFALSAVWLQSGYLYAGLLPWATFPLGTMVIRGIWKVEPGRIYNTFFGMAALLHLVFGVLLSLGFYLR